MKRFTFALVFFASAALAHAQAPNIVSYQEQTFAPGVDPTTGSPIQTNTYAASLATCNQAPPVVPPTVTNPTRIFFDDAANAGKVCIVTLASALLPALPNGVGYVSTLSQTDNLGQTSPRSAASNPFSRQAGPAALTHLQTVP